MKSIVISIDYKQAQVTSSWELVWNWSIANLNMSVGIYRHQKRVCNNSKDTLEWVTLFDSNRWKVKGANSLERVHVEQFWAARPTAKLGS